MSHDDWQGLSLRNEYNESLQEWLPTEIATTIISWTGLALTASDSWISAPLSRPTPWFYFVTTANEKGCIEAFYREGDVAIQSNSTVFDYNLNVVQQKNNVAYSIQTVDARIDIFKRNLVVGKKNYRFPTNAPSFLAINSKYAFVGNTHTIATTSLDHEMWTDLKFFESAFNDSYFEGMACDESYLYVVDSKNSKLFVVDFVQDKIFKTIQLEFEPTGLALGQHVFYISTRNGLAILHRKTFAILHSAFGQKLDDSLSMMFLTTMPSSKRGGVANEVLFMIDVNCNIVRYG